MQDVYVLVLPEASVMQGQKKKKTYNSSTSQDCIFYMQTLTLRPPQIYHITPP